MESKTLGQLLSIYLPKELAEDLVTQFLQIRQDVASQTLGRSAPGKFVESVVQALQYLENKTYEQHPNVDDFLKNIESRKTSVSDGLKICAARIARAMYTLRNKRNILHKGDVDPNRYDLRFLLSCTQWIMAEFIRNFSGTSMQEAGKLIDQIQSPVGAFVEDFGGKKIIHAKLSAKEEIIVVLHSYYPDGLNTEAIVKTLDRRNNDAVKKAVRELWNLKYIEGSSKTEYKLTSAGLKRAIEIIEKASA